MKRLFISVVLILATGAVLASAQTRSKNQSIARLAVEIAGASEAGDLGRLDRLRLLQGEGGVRIVIVHSLSEDDKLVVRRFSSFYRAERWMLNRHPQPGLP